MAMEHIGSTKRRPGYYLADLMLALGFTALMMLEIWVFDSVGPGRDRSVLVAVVATVASAVAGLALVARRWAPRWSFLANLLALYVLAGFTAPSNFYQYTSVVALFSLAMYDRSWASWLALPASLVGVGLYFWSFPDEGEGPLILAACLFWVVVWLAGRTSGGYVERNRLATERDLSAELAETRQVRLDLETERTRMAQELHDILGHTLNVMLVHAGVARRALPEGVEQAAGAIEIIEETGRNAMDELDHLLGFLGRSADGPGRSPQPGLDDLPALVSNASDQDLQVDLNISLDSSRVPQPIQLTLYRITQEALTNARRHASAANVTVSLGERAGGYELTVIDDGVGLDGTTPGRGMVGMMQRAQLHGGAISTTGLVGGGTSLVCTIPSAARDNTQRAARP